MKIRKQKNKDFWKRYMTSWNGLITVHGNLYRGNYCKFMAPRILKDHQDVYISTLYNGNYLFGVAQYIKQLNVVVFQDANVEALETEQERAADPKLYIVPVNQLLDYYTHYGFVGNRDIWHDSCNERFKAACEYWSKQSTVPETITPLKADGSLNISLNIAA